MAVRVDRNQQQPGGEGEEEDIFARVEDDDSCSSESIEGMTEEEAQTAIVHYWDTLALLYCREPDK